MNCCYHSIVNNIYSVTESKLGLRYSYTTATEEDIFNIKLTQSRCIRDGFTSLTSQTSDEELFFSIRTKAWTIFLLLTPKSLKTAVQLQNSAQHSTIEHAFSAVWNMTEIPVTVKVWASYTIIHLLLQKNSSLPSSFLFSIMSDSWWDVWHMGQSWRVPTFCKDNEWKMWDEEHHYLRHML